MSDLQNSGARVVSALPPTYGISDPQMRAWADAMSTAWTVRNGDVGPSDERFVRKGEIADATAAAFVQILTGQSGVSSGGAGSQSPSGASTNVQAVINEVLGSKVVEYLRTPPQQIAVPTAQLRGLIGNVQAEVASETTTRSNKDNSLAQALNTVWATIGGSAALIQDGSLAAVSPAAVVATKWQQVQAAVTDPNTGLVNAVSIKQELNAYASKADGTLNATYGVKLNTNGYVTGFALASTAGAGSAPGAGSSSFAIMADRFSLVSPTNASVVPFTVDSLGNAYFSGKLNAATGTFAGALSAATGTFAGSLSAAGGTFSGSLSAATGTFSGTLTAAAVNAVNTINIGGEQVTIPRSAFTAGSISIASGTVTIQSCNITSAGGKIVINAACMANAVDSSFATASPVTFTLLRGATALFSYSITPGINAAACAFPPIIDQPGVGSYTYSMTAAITGATTPVGNALARAIVLLESQR